MAVSFSTMPQLSSIFAAYASISAFIMLIQTMLNQLVPRQVQQYFIEIINRCFQPRRDCATIVIEERDGMPSNEVYTAAETYLCTKLRPNIDRLKISKRCKDTEFSIKFAQCEEIPDRFEDIELEWRFVNQERKKALEPIRDRLIWEPEKRFFELCFKKKHKQKILDFYLPFVMERAKSIRDERKIVKLHTLSGGGSSYSVNLEHSSTFNTLAMEPGLKNSIIKDLDRFVRRKDFYRKVGRAWKRGYLLYGPPGTGKSSLIAAMANYLKFDIYDLELSNISRDSDLRTLLLRTDDRSILVIEDIDCTVELPDRKGKMDGSSDGRGHSQSPRDQQFTLSGLLNFIDGLWSSCGDERIIIFTTNNKDRLDPALLRPGRMDMHIHMSYLTPDGFKHLASTYLNVHEHHPGLSEVEALIKEMKVTPAQVAEELMKTDDADANLHGLIDFLRKRKRKIERKNAKKGRRVDDGDGGAKKGRRVDDGDSGEEKLGNGVMVSDESDGEILTQ